LAKRLIPVARQLQLCVCENCTLDVQSFFYETEPVGLEDQDWFVNGVIRIRTGLEPKALHKQLQAIEQRLGRRHGGPRFGPRVLGDMEVLGSAPGFWTWISFFLMISSCRQPN